MSNDINGAEVFSAGTHNGMSFTEADLDQIAAAFTDLGSASRVPLKLGHNEDQAVTDGQPALGWVSRIWRSGKKLLADFTDVPTLVFDAIKKGLYKQVSIELLKDYSQKGSSHPWVLNAVALLGADIPAVKELRDLKTLLMASQIAGARVGATKAFTSDVTITHIGEKSTMTPEEEAKLRSDAAAAIRAADEATAKLKTFTEKQQQKEIDAHRAAVKDLLETAVTEGRIYPRTRDRIVNARLFKNDAEVVSAYSIDSVKEEIKAETRADFKEKTEKGAGPTSFAATTDKEPDFSDKPVADLVYFRAQRECVKLGGKVDSFDDMVAATGRVLKEDPNMAKAYFEDQNEPYTPAAAAV